MGTFEDLKNAISSVIKENGNGEITGEILQQTLLSMVNVLGEYATFVGIATPDTNPGTPEQNVFYIASQSGTYPNFNAINIEKGEFCILSNKTGSWAKRGSVHFLTQETLTNYQEKLVSGQNIKTINGNSILGPGNIEITGNGAASGVQLLEVRIPIAGELTEEDKAVNVATYEQLVAGGKYILYISFDGLLWVLNGYGVVEDSGITIFLPNFIISSLAGVYAISIDGSIEVFTPIPESMVQIDDPESVSQNILNVTFGPNKKIYIQDYIESGRIQNTGENIGWYGNTGSVGTITYISGYKTYFVIFDLVGNVIERRILNGGIIYLDTTDGLELLYNRLTFGRASQYYAYNQLEQIPFVCQLNGISYSPIQVQYENDQVTITICKDGVFEQWSLAADGTTSKIS